MNRRDFLNKLKISIPLTLCSTELIATPFSFKSMISQFDDMQEDVFLEADYVVALKSVRKKLKYVQRYVGYGNFNIITFDETSRILKNSPTEKRFTLQELDFIEYIFYYKPDIHGFYGNRITTNLTTTINKKDIKKISYTGHYLFQGKPIETYENMKKDIGQTLILTSGVRSVVKQMKLFLDKLNSVNGNLSEASKSIAPPAFTYHSIGDFDVGKKGFGYANFTSRFAMTPEFNQMRKLKYINMRYTMNNKDGVRYEPWHVKII